MRINGFTAELLTKGAVYVGGVALEKAAEGVRSVGGAIGTAMENHGEASDAKHVSKRGKNKHLFIRFSSDEQVVRGTVTDIDDKYLYTIKGTVVRKLVNYKLTSADGRTVGRVQKSLVSIRNPFKHEDNPADVSIVFDETKIVLKTTMDSSVDYVIEPYGWQANRHGEEWQITNDQEVLFYLSWRVWHEASTYIIDFRHSRIQQIATLISLALIACDAK